MAKQNIRTYVMCPKCKGSDVKLLEVSEEYRVWYQNKDGVIGEEADPECGDILAVRAICLNPDCRHRWTVRGITEIDELPNWPTTEVEETSTDTEVTEETVAETETTEEVVEEKPVVVEEVAEPAVATEEKKKRGRKKAA